jgi:multidrug efflux pump subunit AcrB
MPPGTVTPFIVRFDVGSVPVGFLVFASPTRSLGEIQDLVYARVRPVVSTIPGVSTPPPFGGNQRSIVVTVDEAKLGQYHVSVDDIVNAIDKNNTIVPSGVVRIGDLQRIAQINSVVQNIQDLGDITVKSSDRDSGNGPAVYLRDLGKVEDSTDILTGYALVNSRRTVYMAISKQASASTLAVVEGVKNSIPYMQRLLPDDIKVSFEFDQSKYVTDAIGGLLVEGALGAILTGGVVLAFLGDARSALVVVLSIPFSLLGAMIGLWAGGQSINIMTLSGLALAVGILVDEATVVIENIHSHLQQGFAKTKAIYDASLEVVVPRLLAMLSVVSVFMPSFFMEGVTRSLFVPLSMAVGLAMFTSYLLSGTFVPVMCAWILKPHARSDHSGHEVARNKSRMEQLRGNYQRTLIGLMNGRALVLSIFIMVSLTTLLIYPTLGSEIFPAGNPTGFQLRLKAPTGTRFEKTEEISLKILKIISDDAGNDNVQVTIGYVGSQPPSYAISNIYMWTSGPQEAILLVSFKEEAKIRIKEFEEKLRAQLAKEFPDCDFTFEAGDIVNKILNFGSATPIRVDVIGPNFQDDTSYGRKLMEALKTLPELRDVGIVQPLNYPTVDVNVDRVRAGQLDVTVHEVGRALVSSTYSSRFVQPVYWRDPKSGLSYQVQVEVPQSDMASLSDVGKIPVKTGSFSGPFVRDVAQVGYGTIPGEYDHYNMSRVICIAGNLSGDDLGRAIQAVQQTIDSLGTPPRGVKVNVRGQAPLMKDTFQALAVGVIFAIVCIFLLLVAFFQSVRLSLIIITVIPAIIFGAVAALFLTGTTVNVQSFMGAIMATGVGVANSILVVVFAEEKRLQGMSARTAAIAGAAARLRPVLMTSIAMIAGMIPMATGMSEGGDRTAPLGRAVIGGLLCSTTAVLLVLPLIYAMVQRRASRQGASVMPADQEAINSRPGSIASHSTLSPVENLEYARSV